MSGIGSPSGFHLLGLRVIAWDAVQGHADILVALLALHAAVHTVLMEGHPGWKVWPLRHLHLMGVFTPAL